jgi:hypothetical protein
VLDEALHDAAPPSRWSVVRTPLDRLAGSPTGARARHGAMNPSPSGRSMDGALFARAACA